MKGPGRQFTVVTFQVVKTEKQAKEIAEKMPGVTVIVEKHEHGKPCPAGYDHAHATYDGATFCPGCGRYLTTRLEKKL